jgi:uroporphyrinogen III methyltransferase/synthase
LREHGVRADVVPARSVAEALVEALADVPAKRALIARAAQARDVLPEALRSRGAEVEELALYETVAEALSSEQLESVASADYLLFTSSSTVRYLTEAAGGELNAGGRVLSIGPVTTQTLREHGLAPHLEAVRHDIDGVVEALLADAAGTSGS